jgi:O-antigen ligase
MAITTRTPAMHSALPNPAPARVHAGMPFLFAGLLMGAIVLGMVASQSLIVLVAGGILAAWAAARILIEPYLGLTVLMAMLPLNTWVGLIPASNLVAPAIGALTVGGFVIRQLGRRGHGFRIELTKLHLLMFVFTGWVVFSTPSAALSRDGEGTLWALSFAQFAMLLWLGRQLLRTPRQMHTLMIVVSATSVFSALFGLYDVIVLGKPYASGLVGNNNLAGNYFLLAMVLLVHLYTVVQGMRVRDRIVRLLILGGIVVLVTGTILTVSRAGIVQIALISPVLVYMIAKAPKAADAEDGSDTVPIGPTTAGAALRADRMAMRERMRSMSRAVVRVLALLVVVGVAVLIIVPPETIDRLTSRFRTTEELLTNNTAVSTEIDTLDTRFRLWTAGLHMLADYPLQGVGVGEFPAELRYYGQFVGLPVGALNLGAHNMYVQLAAETGLVGFSMFMLLIGLTLVHLNRLRRHSNPFVGAIALAWLACFILLLIRGLTTHFYSEKFIWFIMGVSQWLPVLGAQAVQAAAPSAGVMRARRSSAQAVPAPVVVPAAFHADPQNQP